MLIPYKCRCMKDEVTIECRDRAEGEGIVEWLEGPAAATISADHERRSPLCASRVMEYVKIPISENAPFLAGKPRLDS
jgi:hypothetical protein